MTDKKFLTEKLTAAFTETYAEKILRKACSLLRMGLANCAQPLLCVGRKQT